MSDDRERRLRDALHGSSLPEAPDSLRAMLATLPADAAEAPAVAIRPHRPWRALAFGMAAVAVTALVVAVGLPVLRPDPAATSAPSASIEPEIPPAVEVLDRDALEAVILAVRAGDLAPRAVVTSAGIIPPGGSALNACDSEPGTLCTEVGVVEGLDPDVGQVAVADRERIKPVPLTATELRGPVALQIATSGPLELLGHVDVIDGPTGAVDVATLKALEATAPDGRVVVVDAWLAGVNLPSCGPAFPEPPPAPFDCPGLRAFLADEPVRPATPEGENGVRVDVPETAVLVQYGAYQDFAPSPVSPGVGGNDAPRRGLYLVRMVTADTEGCQECRGWLVVGRLDPLPDADASTPPSELSSPPQDDPRGLLPIRSPADVAAMLAGGDLALGGTVIYVDGAVTGPVDDCPLPARWCSLGALDGTDVPVTATGMTVAQLLPDTDYPLDGVLAFRVMTDRLEYLGYMGYPPDATAPGLRLADVSKLADLASMPRGPLVFALDGWLVAEADRCSLAPAAAELVGTPFVRCPQTWITPTETRLAAGGDTPALVVPDRSINVQHDAYPAFAPDPTAASEAFMAPRHGVYLVRLLRNPKAGDPEAARGWQIIARLDPPATASPGATSNPTPSSAPSATGTPSPMPTPAPTPVGSPPADLQPSVTARKDDVRVTVTLDRNPLPAGEVTRAVIKVTNLGTTTLHWASDGCATPVDLHATVATPWRLGIERAGNAQMFKRYALGTYFDDDLSLPSIHFRTREELQTGPRGCADLLMRNDIAPGETLRDVRFWDGAASSRWGPPPGGPVTIEGEFGWYWWGNPADIPTPRKAGRIPIRIEAWITGGSTTDLLSPPEAVDAALANAEFAAFVDTLDIGNGHEPFVRYRPDLDTWEVGDISYAEDTSWVRLVGLNARTGEVIAFEDRVWDDRIDTYP